MISLLNKVENILFIYFIKLYWRFVSKRYSKNSRGEIKLFFGTMPIINIKYWSKILSKYNFFSKTVVKINPYSINKKNDFDIYLENILEYYKQKKIPNRFLLKFPLLFLFDYSLKRFNIFHLSFKGFGVLGKYGIDESKYIKLFGSKIIIIPYGEDFLQYNKLDNYSLRHGLMTHYPKSISEEEKIENNVKYWVRNCDVVIASNILEGKYNWDLIPFVNLSLDIKKWQTKTKYSSNNGSNNVVKIAHCPNHRTIKGTEFIIKSIEKLKSENLKVKLFLIEGIPNDQLIDFLREEVDILVEQLFSGYGLNGLEGLATGIPVVSNLPNNSRINMFRRYSYLDECPVISSNPEKLTDDLRVLIKNPDLRKQIGQSGRIYAEKYHSEESAFFMFKNIYDKIWYGKDVDLMNLYNPLNPDSFNNQTSLVKNPLIYNCIPKEYY